jgi:integrase
MSYGDGSIFSKTDKKSGKKIWFVEIRTGQYPDGRPQFTRRKAASKSEAIKIRQTLNSQKLQGKLTQRSNITVAEYGRYWAREVKPNTVKAHTAATYEWLLTRYAYPYIGRKKMCDLTYPMVQDWINNLLNAGYGPTTVNHARSVLGQIVKQALREGILTSDPVSLTVKVKKQLGDKTQVRKAWNLDEAKQALKEAEGTDMDLFVHMCVYLGLRHGEALGLQWSAIDLEKRTIEIKFTLKDERRINNDGKGIVRLKLQEPKTKSSIRQLTIVPQLFDSIERHQMMQSVRKMTAGHKWEEKGMVFTTSIGTPVTQANNLKHFKDWIKKHNLRYIRVHDLRHTFGQLALESGAPLEQVSQTLGHADIGITKKIYAPDVRGFNEKALKSISEFLDPKRVTAEVQVNQMEEITAEPLVVEKPVPVTSRTMSRIRNQTSYLQ